MDLFLANATLYLEMVGHVVMAWMWLRKAEAATRLSKTASDTNLDFYRESCRHVGFSSSGSFPRCVTRLKFSVTLTRPAMTCETAGSDCEEKVAKTFIRPLGPGNAHSDTA